MLRYMGLQRVGRDWTELKMTRNWKEVSFLLASLSYQWKNLPSGSITDCPLLHWTKVNLMFILKPIPDKRNVHEVIIKDLSPEVVEGYIYIYILWAQWNWNKIRVIWTMKEGKIALTEAMIAFQTLNNKIKIITIKSSIYLVPDSAVHIFIHYITQFPSFGKLWEGNMILRKIRQKQNKN